jgi:hypothetical protein
MKVTLRNKDYQFNLHKTMSKDGKPNTPTKTEENKKEN